MGRKLIAELDAEFIEEDLRPYIEYRVTVGFGDEAQIVDDAVDEFKEYFRKAALIPEARRLCAEAIARHIASQQSWPAVTDCDKLDRAFGTLEALGIIARHDFTCCGSCGVLEMWDLIDRIELFEEGRKVVGYTFYNEQDTEPPRDSWRLQLLRGWSHEQASEVFPGSAGAGGADGAGAPGHAQFAVGGDRVDCREDRVHG